MVEKALSTESKEYWWNIYFLKQYNISKALKIINRIRVVYIFLGGNLFKY